MIRIELDPRDIAVLEAMPEKFKVGFARAVNWIADKSVQEAKKSAPHSEGTLRRSISRDALTPTGDGVYIEVGANVPYAYYQEFGFRRHFVPFSVAPSLERWARRHGIEVKDRGGLWVSKAYQTEKGYYLVPGVNAAINSADSKLGEVIDKL